MKPISCIIVDDEPTARYILETLIGQIEGIEIKAICKNAKDAVDALSKHSVDVIFLDINMPERSGISLAKSIRKSTKIIFTTAYREYAVDGFDLQAVDYLLKPISLDRLIQAVDKYRAEHLSEETPSEYMVVRSDRKMVKVDFGDILYIESFSDYLKIHTNSKVVVTRETISNIEYVLPRHQFIRIHRSFIVAIAAIESYSSEEVEIKDKSLPISRSYRNAFVSMIEKS